MIPVTRETLQTNAFRTLGLSASAGQSTIETAARKMRIWPDPSRVPPTPWDIPGLGPIRRAKSDIEQAVALLNQPLSRLEHRLLWFGGDQPPIATPAAMTAETNSNSNLSVKDRHASAISGLQAAWIRPEASDDTTEWNAIIEPMVNVCASEDLLRWVQEVELNGRFEKRASTEEMAAQAAELPVAIAAGVIQRAISALNEGWVDVAVAIGSAVAKVRVCGNAPPPLADLLDRMEDRFNRQAAAMEKYLRDELRTNHTQPFPFYARNLKHARHATEFYTKEVLPIVSAVGKLAENDADRLARIRSRCRVILLLLALAWEWAGAFFTSEKWLNEAMNAARGTLGEREVQQALDRVSPRAEKERKRIAQEARIPGLHFVRAATTAVRSSVFASARRRTNGQASKKQRRKASYAFLALTAIISLLNVLRSTSPSESPTINSAFKSPFWDQSLDRAANATGTAASPPQSLQRNKYPFSGRNSDQFSRALLPATPEPAKTPPKSENLQNPWPLRTDFSLTGHPLPDLDPTASPAAPVSPDPSNRPPSPFQFPDPDALSTPQPAAPPKHFAGDSAREH